MQNYDFLVLSPYEMESLCRDLLQKKLGIFIEGFTPGKDSGIDLRFTKSKDGTTIIQVKRYEKYAQLLSNLKKEVKTVAKLSFKKYIIATNVGLTPDNKIAIKKVFGAYIDSTEDILGRTDLNNLISQYEEIEKRYYKLWLASTPVMNKIFHSKIYNQSAFELESIKEGVKLYVQNNSFNEAVHILKNHHHVIISGIPGIGKTTLARILVLYLLSKDYDEFVYLNDSIDDGYKYFEDSKKQIFFFDDFLGKNYFSPQQHYNTDDKIIKFIDKIKKTPNKLLILATREYILQQARNTFESFSIKNVEIAKCIIDLSSYTNLIKAQILYNHLYFASVPEEHLLNLNKDRNYMKLIRHKNYNPRIIETIINRKIWEHCEPGDFTHALVSYFNNPESVWLHAFENSLDKFSQYVLLVLLTMGTPVLLDDLEDALKIFLRINSFKFSIAFDSIAFTKAIRELENTFIITQKDAKGENIAVEYQNPSIQDFLVNYLRDKNDLIECLLESAIYEEQFFTIFTNTPSKKRLPSDSFSKIDLKSNAIAISIERIMETFEEMKSCRVMKFNRNSIIDFYWGKSQFRLYMLLRNILENLGKQDDRIIDFVYQQFQKNLSLKKHTVVSEEQDYILLLKELDRSKLVYKEDELMNTFLENSTTLSDIEVYKKFQEIFPNTFSESIEQESFGEKLSLIIDKEIKQTENDNLDDLISRIEGLEQDYEWTFGEELKMLNKKLREYDDYMEEQADANFEDMRDSKDSREDNEDNEIDDLFTCLVDFK